PASVPLPHLHSFPTRRSSDLRMPRLCRNLCGKDGAFHFLSDSYQSIWSDIASPKDHPPAERNCWTKASICVTIDGRAAATRGVRDRKSTRLNSSHDQSSYAVF